MQEFLTNNTVNCNLMSLTGYRTLVLLKMLIEGPKTNQEINNYFLNDQYIKEKFSNDTLRIYINSLREIGCNITRANKANGKYELISHPFGFDIPKSQLKAISKLYKNIYDKIELNQAIMIEDLLIKLSETIKNEKTKEYLSNIIMAKGVDRRVLRELINHCNSKNQIIFFHKSAKSGIQEIEIIADKIFFKSEKLYLWGYSITHREYSFYRVDKITKVSAIKIKNDVIKHQDIRITYELLEGFENYLPEDNEKILLKSPNKLILEITSKNKFSLIQKFLYNANTSRIIEPESFKNEIKQKLELMKKVYN